MAQKDKTVPLDKIKAAARVYGERSFDNYAQIRSIAEAIRDGLCQYLHSGKQCVFLVPPQGPFQAQNYGSAAFSVAGKGFLPLEPLSFGLAIRISGDDDYMRVIMTCRKEGDRMFVQLDANDPVTLSLPAKEDELNDLFSGIYNYILNWFENRVDQYDHGSYGSNDIGFDIQRATS